VLFPLPLAGEGRVRAVWFVVFVLVWLLLLSLGRAAKTDSHPCEASLAILASDLLSLLAQRK
jgi:hypothetical protein